MSALQLRLPHMMVCIDEAWAQNFTRTVNNFGGIRRRFDVRSNAGNFVALNEKRMGLQRDNIVISSPRRNKDRSIL